MKPTTASTPGGSPANCGNPLIVSAVSLLLGIVLAGAWFHYEHLRGGSAVASRLSSPVQAALAHLQAPVTIRYYSILPAGSAGADLQAFAGRVNDLLAVVQAAGNGQIKVTRLDSTSDANADAAAADGIRAFNLEKGGACFLGLAIASGSHKETFARLEPEWEPALQYDLARAISRVAVVPPPPQLPPAVAKPSPEIISSIHRLVPDVNATSLADADRIFHEDFLKQCADTGKELEAQLHAAAEQVNAAKASGSAADLEAARKHLLQIQLQQGEKLKQLAANLQTELDVFKQMKSAGKPAQ